MARFFKLTLLLMTFLFLSSCNFAGVNSSISTTLHNNNIITNSEVYDLSSFDNDVSYNLSSHWETAEGQYSVLFNDKGDNSTSCLGFIEYDTDDSYILCDKPNCKHIDVSCNAIIVLSGSYEKVYLFKYNSLIFVYESNKIYSFEVNGHNRNEIVTIPDKYFIDNNKSFYSNNCIYFSATRYSDENDGFGSEMIRCFIQITLDKFDVNEIIVSNENSNENLIGMYKNNIYVQNNAKMKVPEISHNSSQNEHDEIRNSTLIGIDLYDLSNGKKTSVKKPSSAYQIDSILMDDKFIYYHSREDECIYMINLDTMETNLLTKTVKGYIIIERVFDGKLLFTTDNSSTYFENKNPKPNDSYFYDLSAGKNSKIEHKTSSDQVAVIYRKYNGYYYILIDIKSANDEENYNIAKIKIDNYWQNSKTYEAAKWLDEKAFFKLYGNSYE